MKRYYITDRRQLGGIEPLLRCVVRNAAAGVDLIQVREKDLCARELAELVRAVVALAHPTGARVLVNERVDVALAGGADGVHLPSESMPTKRVRLVAPPGFLIAVSTHRPEEVIAAERSGADFVVFGPVFEPLSKDGPLRPRGLAELAEVCGRVRIPVFALGGITGENASECTAVGAAGVAGITLFQAPDRAV